MMEVVGPESSSDHAFPISTGVVIVGSMEGLVEVADQMQHEFQGDQPFFGIGAGVREFAGKLLDLVDHGGPRRANCAGR